MRHILRRVLLITLLMACVAPLGGQTLVVEPGQLAAGLQVPSHAAMLTVKGAVNAADLVYLTSAIEDVATLDLSSVTVVPYDGKRIGANLYSSPANVVPQYALSGLRAAKVILPDGLSGIGDGAFLDSRVTEISVPESVTSVGKNAFAYCGSLTSVSLPSGLEVIPSGLFDHCEALSEVSMPDGISIIGNRAFSGCTSLNTFIAPSSLESIGVEAFAMSGIERVELSGCRSLSSIGDRAFADCRCLSEAVISSSVKNLGEGLFFGCHSLRSANLPSGLAYLPALTFTGDNKLQKINLPESVTSIGRLAMAGLTELKSIHATGLSVVPELDEEVWDGVTQPDVTLIVKYHMSDAFRVALQWQEFSIEQSGVSNISDDGDAASVKTRFMGRSLIVESSFGLRSVTIYGFDGKMLRSVDAVGNQAVEFDTSPYAGPLFIVKAVKTDGTEAVVKLVRVS